MRFAIGLVLVLATAAHAASIGIYSDPGCTRCALDVPPAGTDTLWVAARADDLPSGIWMTGAEFRIVGLPPGWVALAAPEPGVAVALGAPFGAGTNVALAQETTAACVPLFRVFIAAPPAPPQSFTLRISARDPPGRPEFPCPNFVQSCGDPCDLFVPLCVGAGQLWVNGTGDCTTGLATRPWSFVKQLFRDTASR